MKVVLLPSLPCSRCMPSKKWLQERLAFTLQMDKDSCGSDDYFMVVPSSTKHVKQRFLLLNTLQLKEKAFMVV